MYDLLATASRAYSRSLEWIRLSSNDVDRVFRHAFGQVLHPLRAIRMPFGQLVERPPNHGEYCSAREDCCHRHLGTAQTADGVSRRQVRIQDTRQPDEIAESRTRDPD